MPKPGRIGCRHVRGTTWRRFAWPCHPLGHRKEPLSNRAATVRERTDLRLSAAVFMAACAIITCAASAEVNVPDPGTFVVDKAGIIDDRVERELEGWLRELEQKTTAQVKVLTVPTIDGEDIFGFAQRHAERWKLGQKGRDNGALVVVALKERQFRVHSGYGLEPTLPDSWCGQLHREVIIPNFRAGKYSEGLNDAVTAIANRVADASNVQLTGIPQYRFAPRARSRPSGKCGLGIVPFIVIILMLTRGRRNRRRWGGGLGEAVFWGSVLSNLGRGGRSSGWGGGGFGGGGGGFGGSFGGGGRFGGGGGGGSW